MASGTICIKKSMGSRYKVGMSTIAARLFPLYVFLMLFDGLMRKSVSGQSGTIMLVKDGLFAGMIVLMVFSLLISSKARGRLKQLLAFQAVKLCLIVFVVVFLLSLVSLLSDQEGGLQVYLLGFREYFLYIPMLFIAYDYFQDENRRTCFVRLLSLFAIIASVAALLQVIGLVNSSLLQPISDHLVSHSSEFGEFDYVSSTFDVPERFAVFNLFILIASALLLVKRTINIRSGVLAVSLLLSWISLFISGRRVSFVLGTATLFAIFSLQTRNRFKGILLIVASMVVMSAIMFSLNRTLFQVIQTTTISDARFYYFEWTYDEFARLIEFLPPFFYGKFGQTSPGAAAVLGYSPMYMFIEAFWVRAAFALGIVSAVLLFMAQVLMILEMIRLYLRWRDPLISAAVLYLICISAWNWKSGEYLVWIPLTMMIIGMGYAASNAKPSLINQRYKGVRG